MAKRILLVDYENVQDLALTSLPEDVEVRLILGAKQSKLPTELVVVAQTMGECFKYVMIKGQEANAVDFCVAFYLGEYLNQDPSAECAVLSKDKKGFDPLVKHLTVDRKFKVRRVNSQKDAFPKAGKQSVSKPAVKPAGATPVEDPFDRILRLLRKEKIAPAKLKGLEGKLQCWLPQDSEQSRRQLLQRLIDDHWVVKNGTAVTYSLAVREGNPAPPGHKP